VDSFGLVFLEAWAYRKPVIGAAAGGIPEVISEGSDGFLVPFGDVKRLAHHIATLLDDKALAQRMGEEGYRKVRRFYTWNVIFPRLEGIYLRLVG
jgi:glycosyltransferase involved in cell wall biosynthesis